MPQDKRRNYKHVIDAFQRIAREEGITALWKGTIPTIARAMALNFGMLAFYDEAKETLIKLTGKGATDPVIKLGSSAVAGFMASFFSLPFDNAKTKMQKMSKLPDGTYPYKNFVDTILKVSFFKRQLKTKASSVCGQVSQHFISELLPMQ